MKLEEAINIYSELKEHKEIIGNIDTDFFFKFAEIVLQALKKSIPKKKIENKLEQLNSEIQYCARQNGKTIKLGKIMALQELLEEDK